MQKTGHKILLKSILNDIIYV